ncbi:response regulator transcription factor [Methylobacterium sp. SyP6R]|uniref:response regulator transcription factor n=1 Tax=Methylobacterium sp. SyP6R TaxID=2718876 RepID=UPI001F0125A8|nr:response regulator [Methylobacterium sp. SyP6R]MCF4127724.1 LuxR C-terminal-related transcriptional regulator [Methylobacterium sp. SyP6R]
MQTGTVHIVDDDAALRTALVRLCVSAGLKALGYADASALLADPGIARPACILLDVRLTDESGLDVQARFQASGTTIPIVFLTGYGTIPMTVRAMRGGAVEFLTKPADDEAILEAIARALALDAAAQAAQAAQAALAGRLASLTGRERDVFGLAIGGLMNKQIAAELGVSEITAKVHKRRVMEKMEARSLADLVRMASELGIDAPRQR